MFLTELDERARVKGSRDPLGVVPLWSRFGRNVVGNLTTVTDNVRSFTTTLLGYYFADQIMERSRDNGETELEIFLKFEEMAGYTRYAINDDRAIRGYRRVATRTSGRKPLMISVRSEDQILSNMKVYGLWGLYTRTSRSSGLLDPNAPRPSAEGIDLLEKDTLPRMTPALRAQLVSRLSRPQFRFDLHGRDHDLAKGLANMLGPTLSPGERGVYREHLAWGGAEDPTRGLQKQLATLIGELDAPEFDFEQFEQVRRGAEKRGCDDLARRLGQIEVVEHLIVPATSAFSFLQTQNNQAVADVARKIESNWRKSGLRIVEPDSVRVLRRDFVEALRDEGLTDRWFGISDSLRDGAWEKLIHQLIELNAAVMQNRNQSAPWVELSSGRLRVRQPDEAGELSRGSELRHTWRSTYFINALNKIVRELD
ncbi:MAG: hypothetical protein KY459_11915 [Acidobacteria bacterium]|nr:hypothetical protein [Acidobacteriota bacterium]